MTQDLQQRTEMRATMSVKERVVYMESLVDQLDTKVDECDDKHKRDAKLIELLTARVAVLESAQDGGS